MRDEGWRDEGWRDKGIEEWRVEGEELTIIISI
jgi:hypothetical protein